MKNNFVKIIIISYSIILLAGTVFYFSIPSKNFLKTLSSADINKKKQNFYNIDLNQKQSLSENNNILYNTKTWNITYQNSSLKLDNSHNTIYLIRKNTDDNKIEIYSYQSLPLIGGNVYLDKIKPAELNLTGDKLTISYPLQKFKLTVFNKDFTTEQYNEKKTQTTGDRISADTNLLFIKIPKNLNIVNDSKYQYIDSMSK